MLNGYWWDPRQERLACKRKGVRAFCFRLDLLTLSSHGLGRDALEKLFFGAIDRKGAYARDRLLEHGPKSLDAELRSDFARLLLSLDVRRPMTVSSLRQEGRWGIANALDSDAEVADAIAAAGLSVAPSDYVEETLDWCLEDRALATVQRLVDNPAVGSKLINAHWHVVQLGPYDPCFVLSDRPLIRLSGYDRPGAAWVLPLNPKSVFVAVNHPLNLERIKHASPQRLARYVNLLSVHQADQYVFSVDQNDERWLAKYLKRRFDEQLVGPEK